MRQLSKQTTDKMRPLAIFILTTLTFYSCRHDYKLCEANTTDEQLKIYTNILNELIEHRFYNRYLGKDQELIFNEETSDKPDTAKISRLRINLQNKLFNDTAHFCTIYLDTFFEKQIEPWDYYLNSTDQNDSSTKQLLESFSSNGQDVIDSLNSMQDKYLPNDFHLCTSNILPLRELNRQKGKCAIGIVSFSKIFLDKSKTKGLLCYNFICGGLCGKGELLIIEKINDRWRIKQARTSWIS